MNIFDKILYFILIKIISIDVQKTKTKYYIRTKDKNKHKRLLEALGWCIEEEIDHGDYYTVRYKK